MRIVGIIIIILVLGFFGGYGIMQSQIDDQKEFKGVKNVIPMDNRTEQQIEQHDVKVEKSGIISKEQAEIIVLENADMEAKDISGLKTKIENYYGKGGNHEKGSCSYWSRNGYRPGNRPGACQERVHGLCQRQERRKTQGNSGRGQRP